MAQTSLSTEESQAVREKSRPQWRIVLPVSVFICFLCLLFGIGIGFFIAVFYGTSVKDAFSPKTTVYLRVVSKDETHDTYQIGTDISKVLEERSKILGYKNISISMDVSDQNKIVVKMPKEIDYEEYIKQVTAIGLIELVDLGKDALPAGKIVRTDFVFPSFVVNEGLVRHTVITNFDIEEASIRKEDQKVFLDFYVNSKGRDIVKEYTTEHIGHYLAIVLDKEVVIAPMVQAPITEGSLVIEGVDQEQANRLLAFFKTKPLPRELSIEKIVQ